MNNLKIVPLFFAALLIITHTSKIHAYEIYKEDENNLIHIFKWGEFATNEPSTTTIYTQNKNDEGSYIFFKTSLEYSKKYSTRVYFSVSLSFNSACSVPGTQLNSEMWEVNEQAIRMNLFCDDFADNNTTYISATPKTDAGLDFIVNALKRSADFIHVRTGETTFPVSAIGFTATWNANNKKAL